MFETCRRYGGPVGVLAVLGISGCVAPAMLARAPQAIRPSADLSFFQQTDGKGSVTIRILDQRPRGVQSFSDADPTSNGVLFRLSNAGKLKGPQLQAVLASGSVYAAAFSGIPSDATNNYFLTVGLFRNVASPSLPTDPGYGNIANKAGEGGSLGFSVAPGSTTNVTVKINAVGNLTFDSETKVINPVTPVYVQGENAAFVFTGVNQVNTPQANDLTVHVLDVPGTATFSSTVLSRNVWPTSGSATLSFPVPAGLGNYQLLVEASTGSVVLSRRSKLFSVEQAATLDVNLN